MKIIDESMTIGILEIEPCQQNYVTQKNSGFKNETAVGLVVAIH